MRPPKAAVPMWKVNVFPTEDTTVNDPTWLLCRAKYQEATDMAITICEKKQAQKEKKGENYKINK